MSAELPTYPAAVLAAIRASEVDGRAAEGRTTPGYGPESSAERGRPPGAWVPVTPWLRGALCGG